MIGYTDLVSAFSLWDTTLPESSAGIRLQLVGNSLFPQGMLGTWIFRALIGAGIDHVKERKKNQNGQYDDRRGIEHLSQAIDIDNAKE